tara:strand:+ start:35 stop:538 length:504 start_codon:yes stop_codon:yes gene_type:complete
MDEPPPARRVAVVYRAMDLTRKLAKERRELNEQMRAACAEIGNALVPLSAESWRDKTDLLLTYVEFNAEHNDLLLPPPEIPEPAPPRLSGVAQIIEHMTPDQANELSFLYCETIEKNIRDTGGSKQSFVLKDEKLVSALLLDGGTKQEKRDAAKRFESLLHEANLIL